MCTIYGTRGGKQTQSGPRKKISAFFYRTEAGGEPVREWLKTLTKEEKKVIGEDIKTCELGWPIGMPVARALGDGLHEVRTKLPGNRISRVIFYVDTKQRMVLLHGFIKKAQKLPDEDFELAQKNKSKHARSQK